MGKMVQRFSEIYDFVERFKAQWGYSPSHEDIAANVGIPVATVFNHLQTMEILGMVERTRGMVRGIKLLSRKPKWDLLIDPLDREIIG